MHDRGRDPTRPNFRPPYLSGRCVYFYFFFPISMPFCFLNPCFRWKCCVGTVVRLGGIEK